MPRGWRIPPPPPPPRARGRPTYKRDRCYHEGPLRGGGDQEQVEDPVVVAEDDTEIATLRVATINVLTLAAKGGVKISGVSNQYARLPLYLKRCEGENIDIVAFQETKLRGKTVQAEYEGYTFIGSGVEDAYEETKKLSASMAKRKYGVALALRLDRDRGDKVLKAVRVSPRLMWAAVRMKYTELVVFSVYAPQNGLSDEEKTEFYETILPQELDKAKALYRGADVVMAGDFNAQPMKLAMERARGVDDSAPVARYEEIVGPFQPETREDEHGNGHRLVNMCAEYDLVIAGTHFDAQPEVGRGTFRGVPGCPMPWTAALDHILVTGSTWRRGGVTGCGVNERVAEGLGSDHRSVVCDLKYRICSKRAQRRAAEEARALAAEAAEGGRPPRKALEILKDRKEQKKFQAVVAAGLEDIVANQPEGYDEGYEARQLAALYEAIRGARETLPNSRRTGRIEPEWFVRNRGELARLSGVIRLAKERAARQPTEESKAVLEQAVADEQEAIARFQEVVWTELAKDMQKAFDSNATGMFYDRLRQACAGLGGARRATNVIRAYAEGTKTPASSDEQAVERWKQYAEKLLNQDGTAQGDVEETLRGVAAADEDARSRALALDNPFVIKEYAAAVAHMKDERAVGPDEIPVEMYRPWQSRNFNR